MTKDILGKSPDLISDINTKTSITQEYETMQAKLAERYRGDPVTQALVTNKEKEVYDRKLEMMDHLEAVLKGMIKTKDGVADFTGLIKKIAQSNLDVLQKRDDTVNLDSFWELVRFISLHELRV